MGRYRISTTNGIDSPRLGVLVLIVVIFGAVWCVDGCIDPATDTKSPLQSSGTYTCIVCVIPFVTIPRFSLPEQLLEIRTVTDVAEVHLWSAPTFSIDHPPRSL